MEIITGREWRLSSLRDKTEFVAEANEPGAMIRTFAARHGVCEGLLFTWQRQAREGLLSLAPENSTFVPVQTLGSWTGTGGGASPGDASPDLRLSQAQSTSS